MNISSLVKLKQVLNDENVLISFSGPFSHSVIEELGHAIRRHLEEAQVPKSALMDLFSVFIEQSQNVRNYTASATDPDNHRLLNSGILVISYTNGHYAVNSGNLLQQHDTARLQQRLQQVLSLDSRGLRQLFKETARQPISTEGQSAGLGLISMARTATAPLEYVISKVDEQYNFFSLKVTI